MNKRAFLKNLAVSSIAASPFFKTIEKTITKLESEKVSFESNNDFWAKIRNDYLLKEEYINLEGGYYCMLPQPTLERYKEHIDMINKEASYYMRTVQWENRNRMATKLANMAGCSAEELVITRNTTESLDLIIGGYPWKAGDEAVMANQDYGAMLNQFKLVEKRFGVKSVRIDVPMDPSSDDEVVEAYRKVITPKTKLLMVCHMVNITGHILPIQKICDMAHEQGVEVMVDGAHAFAQINFKISDLNCDYYGTSLHKWLSVPLGAGFLYVKKGKAEKIWPLFAEGPRDENDISRLNHIGTHPVHTDLAIEDAIDYHNLIGGERKEKRLRFIQNYWVDKAIRIDHVLLNTPKDKSRSCAIANVGIKGMKPADLSKKLLNEHKIWTVAIDGAGVHGCRITPNIYTTTNELDQFISALSALA